MDRVTSQPEGQSDSEREMERRRRSAYHAVVTWWLVAAEANDVLELLAQLDYKLVEDLLRRSDELGNVREDDRRPWVDANPCDGVSCSPGGRSAGGCGCDELRFTI